VNHPTVAPPWFRFPPHTINADGTIEFLQFNPGFIKISGRELERLAGLGHDSDVNKVAKRAQESGHIETWVTIGKDLYVRLRKELGHSRT